MPDTVSSSMPSAECSNSSCRHRPQGISALPCPSTQVNATSLPPPDMCRADTSEHSAHRVRPYEAFSTLAPVSTRPSSAIAATPTGNLEYGTYAWASASLARARSDSQSTSDMGSSDLGLDVRL